MVFIDDRIAYLSDAIKNDKLRALHSLLWNKDFNIPSGDHNEVDGLYYKAIVALKSDNLQLFSEVYGRISKRTPSKESAQPFVYHDPLLFVLITGVVKFSLNKDWLLSVMSIRQRNIVTITFENIINGNYLSKSNSYGIIISISRLLSSIELTNEYLNEGYATIMEKLPTIDIKSDIEMMSSYCGIDEIVTTKEMPVKGNYSRLKTFEKIFLHRTNVFSVVLYVLILVAIISGTLYILNQFPKLNDHVNKFGVWYGVIFGIVPGLIPGFRKWFVKRIQAFFGYKL